MARKVFFGGNTPQGFFHCFGDILFLDEARKIIYMKGSSGSGKSTLMRKVAQAFEERGREVEYIHCSNNVSDLDGICIRELGIAMTDATAPHACDPSVPVAIDEIFNAADYIDRDYVTEHAAALRTLQALKKQYFDKAYGYLAAAYQVYRNSSYIHAQTLSAGRLEAAIAAELERFHAFPIADKPGRNRRMFATAITPQGNISFLDTLLHDKTVIRLLSSDGMGSDLFLERLRQAANTRGLATEGYYSPLDVRKLDHVIIPALNLAYISLNEDITSAAACERHIDFSDFIDRSFLRDHAEELQYNRHVFDDLRQRAMEMMASQKDVHDRIERIYVASMDFIGLNAASREIMHRLLALDDPSIPAKEARI